MEIDSNKQQPKRPLPKRGDEDYLDFSDEEGGNEDEDYLDFSDEEGGNEDEDVRSNKSDV
jgi:hypothetical protein